jgi:hypothetical protein
MKRLWKKNVDRITTQFINHPYERAALAVMFGVMAIPYLSRHDSNLADHVLGYCLIFSVIFHIYFLARAIDTLRVEDTVPHADELVGLHLNQK